MLTRLFPRLFAAPAAARAHSVANFRGCLRRECARADRTGREFSLLVLAPSPSGAAATLELLGRRLRETDEIGWMEGGSIGALLTDTGREGAQLVAGEVLSRLERDGAAPLAHTVFTYPGDWMAPGAPAASADQAPEPAGAAASAAVPPCLAAYPLWKRVMDVAGALVAILVLSPVLLAVALAVRLSSAGPVFFRQERIGYGGRRFRMWKFRSMYSGAGDAAHAAYLRSLVAGQGGPDGGFKLRADPRITPVGRFIRRWSLDELPQLFNVLRGDMGLVGPRPEPAYATEGYAQWYYRRVLGAKPGITGLWQVHGRSRVSYETMVRMDLRYGQRLSPLADARLLLQTVRAVLSAEGAY
ncbi:MAG TPA: sugar transferase [Longimicrobium sp.]|nr:sugar transferase [Longimicrobium sp.]